MNGNSEIFSLLKRKIRKIMRTNRQGGSERDTQREEPELRMRVCYRKEQQKAPKRLSDAIIYKYFEPEKFHVIYGDFLIFNDIHLKTDEFFDNGLVSGFNLYKKIEQISYDKQLELVSLEFSSNSNVQCPTPEILTYRLRSLGNLQAKELAEAIEDYYSFMQSKVEDIVANNKLVLDAMLDIERTDEKKRNPLMERYEKLIKENPIPSGVVICPNSKFQKLRDDFLKEYKDDTHFGLVTRFNIGQKPFNCEIVEIFFNKNLLYELETDPIELRHSFLRSGIKEFLNSDFYYRFWTILYRSRMGLGNLNTIPLVFTSFKNNKRGTCIDKCVRRFFLIDGFLYFFTIAIMKMDRPLAFQKEKAEKTEELKLGEAFPEIFNESQEKYMDETQSFMNSFYSKGFKAVRRRKLLDPN